MPNDIVVRAVLDSSAVLSYARGHVHVGELLIEVADEEALVALPVLALLDAYTHIAETDPARGRIEVLAALPTIMVLPLERNEAADIAAIIPLAKGDLPRAHTTWAALQYGAYYITVEPELVPPNIAASRIQAIPAEDA
jgi:hypothetical protein